MVAAFVRHGALTAELVYDTCQEMYFQYAKIQPYLRDFRKKMNLPEWMTSIERLVEGSKAAASASTSCGRTCSPSLKRGRLRFAPSHAAKHHSGSSEAAKPLTIVATLLPISQRSQKERVYRVCQPFFGKLEQRREAR